MARERRRCRRIGPATVKGGLPNFIRALAFEQCWRGEMESLNLFDRGVKGKGQLEQQSLVGIEELVQC
ncbi:hypothetical protein GCM10010987_76030 [Bradyrhizobium guangdongense]|uniref:Uncharacterized protein n=1 Tax=Bradyrhizobium guangdongense TaxID=1325090 RepID=A0AA87WBK9_9BRAD|nr:hypothetical protein GCM10010987_76030 [Bradyrhizobium guangdongense]